MCDDIGEHISKCVRFKEVNGSYYAEAYYFTVIVEAGMTNAIVICKIRGIYNDRPETH